ncbi:MAG: flagellar hook-associated protein FlgK [Oligoflexia bacterium]|nr:flagellar hook-associated protein FlgK [Oligoflexia bacterium]
MSPRIGSMMSVGKQALSNASTQLQTTTHNVANVNTEGYSRQRVEVQSAEPIGSARVRIGQGAKTVAVTRVVNNYLNKQIQEETSKMGTADGRQQSLERVEQIYNESINKGLNRFMANFFNAFREFSNNPESQATRALVKESAKILTEDFHRIHNQLLAVQKDVDSMVRAHVSEINGYTKEIASLNEKIQMVELQGVPANDERDRRELILKKLGELVNIRWAEGDNGKITVTAGNNALLVSGYESNQLLVQSTPATDVKREGNADIIFKNGPQGSEFVVTNQIQGGKLGGALEVRDRTINELHGKLDEIAFRVHDEINGLHTQGFDKYGNTGLTFFDPMGNEFNSAINLKLADHILADPGHIAGALSPNSPGDNRVANAIAAIQHQKIFNERTTSIDDFFNGIVGEFAVLTKKNKMVLEHQKHIVDQLKNVRESVSGVSLDEETTDMVKFQKAFDASARLIKTADEMFDTVLSLKRL